MAFFILAKLKVPLGFLWKVVEYHVDTCQLYMAFKNTHIVCTLKTPCYCCTHTQLCLLLHTYKCHCCVINCQQHPPSPIECCKSETQVPLAHCASVQSNVSQNGHEHWQCSHKLQSCMPLAANWPVAINGSYINLKTAYYYLNTYIKWDTIFQTKMWIYDQNQWLNTVFRCSIPFLVPSIHHKSLKKYVLWFRSALVSDIITSMIYNSEVYIIYITLITHTIDNLLLHQTYLFQYSTFFYNLDQVPNTAHK